MRRAAPLAGVLMLGGCAFLTEASPPPPAPPTSDWAIERQIERCRQTQSGGTRTGIASAGALSVGASVTAVARTTTPETAECPAILALGEDDVKEIRTLTQAAAASARGLDTNWETATGIRRELALSVYPDSQNRDCRLVTGVLTVFSRPALTPPQGVAVDEQRFCRAGNVWDPKP